MNSTLDARAERSVHYAIPLVAKPNKWRPVGPQVPLCWFLGAFDLALFGVILYELFWRH